MKSHKNLALVASALGMLAATSAEQALAAQSEMNTAFEFTSGVPAYDQAYQKARGVIAADVKDGKFLAGQNWAQVWTRDSSYSVELACALLHPDVSKTTLLGLTQSVAGIGECWYQDKCGHFAGWPNLTDAIVGASGAWALYLVTGDRELVRPIYERTVRSLKRAEQDAYDPQTGLFRGCASFMESNSGYPQKYAMKGDMIARTCALSTCLLYYRGYLVAAQAGTALGEDVRPLREKAAKLKEAINTRLWLPEKGYYAYFLDENGELNPRMEGLGEAFAILTGVADAKRARQILRSTPTTAWGFPCLWPQFDEWRDYKRDFAHYYHNGMIWPFVRGLLGMGGVGAGRRAGLRPGAGCAGRSFRRRTIPLWSSTARKTANPMARRASYGAPRASCLWSITACSAWPLRRTACGSPPWCRRASRN